MVFKATIQSYYSYIMAVNVIDGENRVVVEKQKSAACHWQTISHKVVSSAPCRGHIKHTNGSCDRHWLYTIRCKSKYHMINVKTAVRILFVFHHDALINYLSGIMVSVLASSPLYRGFAKHAALRRKSKDLLARFSIMCPSGATCRYSDCCFSELAL